MSPSPLSRGHLSNLRLEPNRLIVQSWRTTRFAQTGPDSRIEVLLETVAAGTRVTVQHTRDGRLSYRDGGCQDNFFDTMKARFAATGN
jgi:Activator of Hsp90 ATPase homolog 1-like protein